MKILTSVQRSPVADPVRSKLAMVAPILEATLYSLAKDRAVRLGGYDKITLADLGRELLAGDGDAGICFEFAVHQAVAAKNPLIHTLASEVLQRYCGIKNGASSILFGPEKEGRIPVIESATNSLTEDSRVYVGNRGQPPKLRRYIPQIVRAFHRHEEQSLLPRSINGLWKADLFLGNVESEKWVGTTVKVNSASLEGAKGLRIGIYPRKNAADKPRMDADLNLIRLPLPYDGAFMEVYYKSFFLVRAFLKADARVPAPLNLPDAEDRYVTKELEERRVFEVVSVIEAVRAMAQPDLLDNQPVVNVVASATLSATLGLVAGSTARDQASSISVTPQSLAG